MSVSLSPNPGMTLRRLRERVGKSQFVVEAEAELGWGYLQRLELGKVKQPDRTTLIRLLGTLRVDYQEHTQVLRSFGYAPTARLPAQAEVDHAARQVGPLLEALSVPSYLLDCAHRLVVWNHQLSALLRPALGSTTVEQLAERCIVDIVFNPRYGLIDILHNRDSFLPYFVHVLQREYQPYRHESWCQEQIDQLRCDLPDFCGYWDRAEQAREQPVARGLVPCQLVVPSRGLLQFQITSEPLSNDPRFRIITYLPLDAATIADLQRTGPSTAQG